jgi:hypothetical protein
MQPKIIQTPVKNDYKDNFIDRFFIWLFSRKMSQALGVKVKVKGYAGFVDLSQQIMQGRNAEEQQMMVDKVLQSLVPEPILWAIRTFFSPTQLVCVLNAWFAAQTFKWLVGSCEIREAEVDLPDGTMRSQFSGVYVKKCRYLEDSGCVGMCVNLCKVPTQTFLTKKFGIPLTMTPNFEDLSCTLVFGQIPPTPETDSAYQQSCLKQQCPTARLTPTPCPKLS